MLIECLLGSLFFFFKQKTAYEMVMSDWSSDVCSSDLVDVGPGGEGTIAPREHHGLDVRLVGEIGRASCRERVHHRVDLGGRRIIKKKKKKKKKIKKVIKKEYNKTQKKKIN